MKSLLKKISVLLTVASMSGCSALVTSENSYSFDSWELCTLLHNPESLYSNWISMDEEDAVIRRELARRGILTKQQCTFESLSEAKCSEVGFVQGTDAFAQCRLDTEQNYKELFIAKKQAHDARTAAEIQQNQINTMIIQDAMKPAPLVIPPTPNFNY